MTTTQITTISIENLDENTKNQLVALLTGNGASFEIKTSQKVTGNILGAMSFNLDNNEVSNSADEILTGMKDSTRQIIEKSKASQHSALASTVKSIKAELKTTTKTRRQFATIRN